MLTKTGLSKTNFIKTAQSYELDCKRNIPPSNGSSVAGVRGAVLGREEWEMDN